MIEAFPLCWPDGQPRVGRYQRRSSAFKVEFGRARDDLLNELALMGAREVIVSTDIRLRRDGLPLASEREPEDPGVAVYFTHGKRRLVIACDSYTKIRWNMRACGVTVEALRTIQRHGASELLERAFTGFAALPPRGGIAEPWWVTLGVERTATDEQIKSAWRALAAKHHPDVGGDAETMMRINRASDLACARGAR